MKFRLLLLLFIPLISIGQKKVKSGIVEFKEDYGLFGKKYNLSFSKRLQKYPFNLAHQIKLVSFDYDVVPIKDTIYYNPIMPRLHYTICRTSFSEIKSLNYLQVDNLTNILLNYGYIRKPTIIEFTKCYEPRNGILFLNEKGKVFEFIEICFGCKRLTYSYNDKATNDFEKPKFKVLREFFVKNGLEYGITKLFDGQTIGNWEDN